MLGIILIDKPLGATSHDVVARLRRTFDTRRIGHAGTLDPLATGLLVVAVGPATRFLQYLPLEPKVYDATIRFGSATTTQDAEGEIVESHPVPEDLRAAFERNVPEFLGLIRQIPPMYSAVKKDGKPLYTYARRGEAVEREPRTVHIGGVDVLASHASEMVVRITCSGGTYVRTWAHDLGQAIGCGAHLVALRRLMVGKFTLDEAIALDGAAADRLIPLSEALPPTPLVELDPAQVEAIRHGRAISLDPLPEGPVAGMLAPSGEVIGIGRLYGSLLKPECVIPALE